MILLFPPKHAENANSNRYANIWLSWSAITNGRLSMTVAGSDPLDAENEKLNGLWTIFIWVWTVITHCCIQKYKANLCSAVDFELKCTQGGNAIHD